MNRFLYLQVLRKLWIKKYPEKYSSEDIVWANTPLKMNNPNYGQSGEPAMIDVNPEDIQLPEELQKKLE